MQFNISGETETGNSFKQQNEEARQRLETKFQTKNQYGISVPDAVFEQWNEAIKNAADPEEEAHRIGSAYQWSQILGVPLDEAYQNLESYNGQYFGDQSMSYKSGWKAVSDMIILGNNNVALGNLGNKLRDAVSAGDDERVAQLQRQIEAYEADNEARQNDIPRSWVMEAVKAGAQSLPFTGYTVGAGLLGNFIAPAVGTALSFGTSAYLSAGQEYLDMIKNGSSHEVATGFSLASGAIQGAIEVALGNVAQSLSVTSKVAGNAVKETLSDAAVRRITNAVGKAVNLGPAGKTIVQLVTRYGENVLEEGSEELFQELTSIVGQELAAQLDGYDIPDDSMGEIMSQLSEAFKGGVYGALTLGILPTAVNTAVDVADFKAVKQAAETIPSEAAFKKAVENSPVFAELDPYTKSTVIKEVYDNAQSRRDAAIQKDVEEVIEVNRAAEGFEDITVDEETGESNAAPVYREGGKLSTQNDVVSESDGVTKGIYKAGDPTAENAKKNLYGYINYTLDENAKTVTIDAFQMNEMREGLREEVFSQFARDYAGYDISWDPKGDRALNIKNELISRNPSGSGNGLNWFTQTSVDEETRTKLAKAVKQNFKNISRDQLPAAIAIVEDMARSVDVSISQFIDEEFGGVDNMFGDTESIEDKANEKGRTFTGKDNMTQVSGATTWRLLGNDIKAIIYAGESSDFSTLVHETNHAYLDYIQKLADKYYNGSKQYKAAAELLEKAEKAFNVKNHDWTKSTYTMADGHIESSAEALAYGFQDFLKTGTAQNEDVRSLYQKLAEFLSRCINSLKNFITLNPDVMSVYEDMTKGDGSSLRAAEEAVRKIDEKSKADAEQAQVQKEEAALAKKEYEAETVIQEEETAGPEPVSDADKALQKAMREQDDEEFALSEEEAAAIVQDDEAAKTQQKEIEKIFDDVAELSAAADIVENAKETLQEPLANQTDAESVIVDTAGAVYTIPDDIFFQIIGEFGATQLDRQEEVTTRMDNLSIAREMETAGKDAKTIRLATGWEKGADGKWRYEIDDNQYEIQDRTFYPGYNPFTLTDEETAELDALRKKLRNNDWNYSKFTEEEQERFNKLTDEENFYVNSIIDYSDGVNITWKKFAELQNVLKADELFKAYPFLKSVKFKRESLNGKDGVYYPNTKTIILDDKRSNLSTLIHEIQHAIQHHEGFARGGTIDSVVQNYQNKIYDRMNEAYREYHTNEELKKDYDEYKKLFNKVANASEDEFMAAYDELFKFEESHENVTRFNKELEKARKDLNLEYNNTAAPLFNSRVTDTYYDREYDEIVKELTKQYYDIHAIDDYQAIAGEVEARNVQKRFDMSSEERLNTLLAETEDVARDQQIILFQAMQMTADEENNPSLLFQKAYHGTSADFEKFDTENYGLSGEGSMSFGYGTYVSGSEEIARDYAIRQADDYSDPNGTYEEDLKTRHLYTVEIPDNGFIKWDGPITQKHLDIIAPYFVDEMEYEMANGDFKEEWPTFSESQKNTFRENWKKEITELIERNSSGGYVVTGDNLYYGLYHSMQGFYGTVNKAQKAASRLLRKAGFTGIDYPAGTSFGTDIPDARNYVIFDDSDVKIIDHIAFQTQQELYADARQYDTWQEFMEAYQMDFDPVTLEDVNYHSQVPSQADSDWYRTTWELAHNLIPTESMLEDEVRQQYEKEPSSEVAKDAMFMNKLENEGALEEFLERIKYVRGINFNSEEWSNPQDIEEQIEFEKMKSMQTFINQELRHANWLTKAENITPSQRRKLLNTIRPAARDYRAVYAQLMEDKELEVPAGQKIVDRIRKSPLADPDRDYEAMTPNQRAEYADMIENKEVGRRIKKGDIRVSDDVNKYIQYLDGEIKKLRKEYDELSATSKEDLRKFSDAQLRAIYRQQDKLYTKKRELANHDKKIQRMVDKGIAITEKYRRESKLIRDDYNSIYQQYQDLLASVKLTEKIENILSNREKLKDLEYNLDAKNSERRALYDIKQNNVKLIKRAMRAVPFQRVDYDSAKSIIAIQRIFNANLQGGINEWLGQDRMALRAAASAWLTSEEERDNLRGYLDNLGTESSKKAIEMLDSLKSSEGIKAWTEKERKMVQRILPKENWVYDLNLIKLEDERRKSIDLDIDVKAKTEKRMNPKTKKMEPMTTYTITFDDDIKAMVEEALGPSLYDKVLNIPFREWTINDLEQFAIRINEMYKEGRDKLAAKQQLQREEAQAIRNAIETALNDTGIVIRKDDTPEEKKKKQEKINRILGLDADTKGTSGAKKQTRLNRLLHGYSDATVRRVASILDGNRDGLNVNELYFKEDRCYNAKQRSINSRAESISALMDELKINPVELNRTVTINGSDYTIDELLYFLAADQDYQTDEVAYSKSVKAEKSDLSVNDNWAPTSRNAVMFGNMMSANEMQTWKQALEEEDKDMKKRIEGNNLTAEELQDLTAHILDKMPGTTKYIKECQDRYGAVLAFANRLLDDEYPVIDSEGKVVGTVSNTVEIDGKKVNKWARLLEAISADYSNQYDRMNEISIKEFNMPVNRVKCYVPLVRLESNGDTNAAQVRQDLLTSSGGYAVGNAAVGKGFTKRRVNISPLHQKPVQTGLYKTWAKSVERTEHFIAYSSYVRELNRIYKSRDAQYLRRYMENRYGAGMVAYLDDYINEVANPNANKVRTAADDLMRSLRGKTAPAYLSWKLSSVLKQALTSPAPYMQFITPAEYARAAWECATNNGYDVIKEKSVFMKNRTQDPLYDLLDELSENAKGKAEQAILKFSQKGMAGLEWIDWACVAPGWYALYQKKYAELKNGNQARYDQAYAEIIAEQEDVPVFSKRYMTEQQMQEAARNAMLSDAEIDEQAVQYADDLTRQCQPSSRTADIAPLFKNSSEFAKAYLQFQTSLNVIWNNLRYDLPNAVHNKQAGRVIGMIAGYTVAGIAMNALMEGFTGGDGKDDDDEALKRTVWFATTQFTDSVPLIGSYLTSTAEKLITGQGSPFGANGTDMTPMITKFGDATVDAFKGNWNKACQKYAEGVAMNIGLSTSGAKEIMKLFGVDVIGDKPSLELNNLGNVYGIFGDIFPEKKRK